MEKREISASLAPFANVRAAIFLTPRGAVFILVVSIICVGGLIFEHAGAFGVAAKTGKEL